MCLICSKTKFITNITNVTGIHTFSFYKRHTFTTTNITFITKHTQFTKINIDPVAGPKSEILRSCGGTVPPKVLKLYFSVYFLIKCVSFVVKYVQFVVKLSLSQISLMLPEFTYFIFRRVYHYRHNLPQNINILSKPTLVPQQNLSVSLIIIGIEGRLDQLNNYASHYPMC